MPIDGFNITNSPVVPLGAVPLDSCPDVLPYLLRVIEIAVKAYLFLSQGPMEVLNPSYGLSIPKGNTPMIYAHLA